MRGYYRAVKRGDAWAVKIARLIETNPTSGILALLYRNADMSLFLGPKNSFISMLAKHDFGGAYYPIPLKVKQPTEFERRLREIRSLFWRTYYRTKRRILPKKKRRKK